MVVGLNRVRSVVALLFLATSIHATGAAELQYPLDVAATKDGTLFIADRKLPGIWKVSGGKASIYFQASKQFRTRLNAVRCVAIDNNGQLLAGDSATREVYRFDADGKPVPLTKGRIGIPMSIAVHKDGSLYVSDLELQRIWKVSAAGGEPTEVAQFAGCRGLVFDKDDQLWALSTSARKGQLVKVVDGKVEPLVKGMAFDFPHNVVIAKDGQFIVSDSYAKALWRVDLEGKATKWVSGEPFKNPVGLGWNGDALLVVDPRAKSIFSVDADGKVTAIKIAP
ncbi:MAG: SMP-30/gluconolactonase/LRE family protein [Planctomycetota bacterium]|nr:SMP-30/gluconolactonase/LRE family protein [Planctomycetota bacterium]